ncbi:uncharacterized protein TNCV_1427181 [Trichonephila clavipes]|nr:uncharacterized protein TNCV_1427181 [Trichonephila clavipes]
MPLRLNRRQYEQLTDFDRGRIIGLREAGWSNRRIGRHLGRAIVVARCWQSGTEGAIYQQDNARPHTARLSQQCLQGYDVLPRCDLSPIEHVWTLLGRQLQPSRDTEELTAQMQRLWQDLPQGVISDFESMPRRISACIAARGGFTTY